MHSTASDGDFFPKEIVDIAVEKKIKTISITDHDSLDALDRAISYAKDKKIEFITGIEISCCEKEIGYDEVHILGYFINHKSRALRNFVAKIQKTRLKQKKDMIQKLRKFGFALTFKEIQELAKSSIGRVHIAKRLLKKYPSEFSSIRDVFNRYIGLGKPAYVPRENVTRVIEAVDAIKKSGGIAILAHPGAYSREDSKQLIEYFIECSGDGIEGYYPYNKVYGSTNRYSSELNRFFRGYAKKKKLLITGGSDFHGIIRDCQIGEMKIPVAVVNNLKKYLFSNKQPSAK